MVIKKIKRIYRIEEETRKPIIIEFRKPDGSVVRFKAIKIVKKPQKIVFRKIKKTYHRPELSKSKEKAKDD